MTQYNSYYKQDHDALKFKFKGSENINQNYSQAFQDIFVLSILNGKKEGTYVEIGGDHPIRINNSYLLETEFDWKGVSFEIDQAKVDYYNTIRKNKSICTDATEFDYLNFFKENSFPNFIDYLQVDIEPSYQTLKALKKLPHDEYKFSVITFETDLYKDGPDASNECHEILIHYGYQLLVKNVANEGCPYENWYIYPEKIDKKLIKIFENISEEPKEAITCILRS